MPARCTACFVCVMCAASVLRLPQPLCLLKAFLALLASTPFMASRFAEVIADMSPEEWVRELAALPVGLQIRIRHILESLDVARQHGAAPPPQQQPPPQPHPVPRARCQLPCRNPNCADICGRPIRVTRSRNVHENHACRPCHRAGW